MFAFLPLVFSGARSQLLDGVALFVVPPNGCELFPPHQLRNYRSLTAA